MIDRELKMDLLIIGIQTTGCESVPLSSNEINILVRCVGDQVFAILFVTISDLLDVKGPTTPTTSNVFAVFVMLKFMV